MAKTSPTKLFIFFIFFASVRILDNLAPISAIVDHRIPHNSSSGTGADPCQNGPWKYATGEVGRVEGNCDESDMESFANAVTCTREFLLDRRPYHAASFVYKLHRHNAGKFVFFAEALLSKLDLNPPSFFDECRRKGDREMVLEYYHRGLDLLLQELDHRGIFEERDFYDSEEDEHDNDDDVDDDDLSHDDDDESDQDIEANFFD